MRQTPETGEPQPAPTLRELRSALPWLVAILVLASALFLYRLDANSLSGDEVNMLNLAIGERDMVMSAGNALAYFPLLRQVAAHSTTPFSLRLPAVVFAVLGLVGMFCFASFLSGRTSVGLAATLLTATAPFYIMHAQMAHAYSLFFLVAALSMTLFWTAYHQGRRGLWIAWATTIGLAMWVHLYTIFMVVAQLLTLALWWVWDRRGALRRPSREEIIRAGVLAVIALILAGPVIVQWILPFAEQLLVKISGGEPDVEPLVYQSKLDPWAWATYIKALRLLSIWRAPYFKLWYLLSALALLGLTAMARQRPKLAVACLIWLLVPVPLVAAFSQMSGIDFGERRLMFLFPILTLSWAFGLLALAQGTAALASRSLYRLRDKNGVARSWETAGLSAFAVMVTTVVGLTATMSYYQIVQNYDVKTAARLVELQQRPGDIVIPWRSDLFRYYYQGIARIGAPPDEVRKSMRHGATIWYIRPLQIDHRPSNQKVAKLLKESPHADFRLGGSLHLTVSVNDPERDVTYLQIASTIAVLHPNQFFAQAQLGRELHNEGYAALGSREYRRVQALTESRRLLQFLQ